MSTNKQDTTLNVPSKFNQSNAGGVNRYRGVYLGKVIDIVDDRYEGYIYVDIIGHNRQGRISNKESRQKAVRVRRALPYGGHYQGSDHTRSYGMSCHPPAPGTEVVILFTGTDQEGIMIGVLPDTGRNSSIGDNTVAFAEGEQGVAHTYDTSAVVSQDKNTRPRHELTGAVANQGLGLDSLRGLSSSGARRESPSNVFGFNTPSGHSLVLDDGTTKNSDASLAPDKERKEGLSNLVRLRSAGGAQMLFNDSAGIVYVINQAGNSWVQLDSDGKIDIYSSGDISMHTENDMNLHVGGDFSLDADAINMKARGTDGIKIETATGEFNLHSAKDIKLTTDLNQHLKAVGNVRVSTDGLIDLNGPPASAATKTTNNNITTNRTVKQSITGRVPEAEPYGGHTQEQSDVPSSASSDSLLTGKDIDMTKVTNNSNSPPNNPKTNSTKVGGHAQTSKNTNPRNGGPF